MSDIIKQTLAQAGWAKCCGVLYNLSRPCNSHCVTCGKVLR